MVGSKGTGGKEGRVGGALSILGLISSRYADERMSSVVQSIVEYAGDISLSLFLSLRAVRVCFYI